MYYNTNMVIKMYWQTFRNHILSNIIDTGIDVYEVTFSNSQGVMMIRKLIERRAITFEEAIEVLKSICKNEKAVA